jgi:NADP-dependent 3-hydroxy acid dehydrogenase YdfG
MFDMDKKCRIINVNPGYVKTEMTKNKHDTIPMLSATEVTDMILWTLNQPQHIEIGEISMWLTSLDHDK